MIEITLPFPPSVNTYWRNVKGKTLISAKGRQYRRMVQELAMVQRWPKFGIQRLSVTIYAYPPDKRRRDLDNLLKAPLDALQSAGIYTDDSQIDDLRVTWGVWNGSGDLIVVIMTMGEGDGDHTRKSPDDV